MGAIEENNAFLLGFASKGVILVKEKVDVKTGGIGGYVSYGALPSEDTAIQYENISGYVSFEALPSEDTAIQYENISSYVSFEEPPFNIDEAIKEYTYYLYFSTNNIEYLFLSNSNMHIMRVFCDDLTRSEILVPAPYIPSNVIGSEYTNINGKWNCVLGGGQLNKKFTTGITDLTIDNFVSSLSFLYSNYDISLYDNDTAGIITNIGTIQANRL